MEPGPPRRRRARPVADAPIDALLLRAEDLAKGWLLALLEQAPLDDAPEILAADLARDGPRVCEAVIRALPNDDDLHRLSRGGALEPLVSQIGRIAGARSPEAIARAVDALHAVVWTALREELRYPDPEQIAELAERLALVIELVRTAALRQPAEQPRPRAVREEPGARIEEPVSRIEERGARIEEPMSRIEERGRSSEDSGSGVEQPPTPAAEPGRVIREPSPAEPGRVIREPSPAEPGRIIREPPPVHDALWIDALEEEIERAGRLGTPLSLLLVELEDADRMRAVEPQPRASATFGRFAQAVRSAMRRKDILALETSARAWLIARDTGRTGAQALASRVASAVREAHAWHGAPLGVSVGVAVLGEDGRDSVALREAAEEARFAASASGLPVMSLASEPESEGPQQAG